MVRKPFISVAVLLAEVLLLTPGQAADSPAPKKTETDPPKPDQAAKASPAQSAPFPWALDHEYRLSWVYRRNKSGETTFRISAVKAPVHGEAKDHFLSKSSFWHKREGTSQEGKHETYFDSSWKPVRYIYEQKLSGLNNQRSRQHHEGEMKDGRLVSKIVHNGDEANAVRSEVPAPHEAYLFLNQSMDNWAILVGEVLRGGPSSREAKVIYPDLLKVYEMRFVFEKEEPVDPGKAEKPLCRRYSFRDREGQFMGKVWLNGRGQMVLHEQGDLRVYLED